jgi:hypothetical protein
MQKKKWVEIERRDQKKKKKTEPGVRKLKLEQLPSHRRRRIVV